MDFVAGAFLFGPPAQHFVNLEVQISWQAQYFVDLEVQISWQVQYFVDLEVQIFVAAAVLCGVAGAVVCGP